MPRMQAVFLDRDGTMIKAVYRPGFANGKKEITAPFFLRELEFMEHVNQVLLEFRKIEYLRIMITNQPDVAHGYMSQDNWDAIHATVLKTLELDDFMICRHTAKDRCPHKKPKPGMLLAMADKWNIDLACSWMIGDTTSDMKAGAAAGCRTVLIDAIYNKSTQADFVVPNLSVALKLVRSFSSF